MSVIIENKVQSSIPTLHVYDISNLEKKPVVLILHGYTGTKEGNIEIAYKLAKEGFYTITFDAVQHGELKNEKFDKLNQLEKDRSILGIMVETANFINTLVNCNADNVNIDIERIALIGFSMGGNIIYYYISRMLLCNVKAVVPFISTPVWGNAYKKYIETTEGAEQYFDKESLEDIYNIQPSNYCNNLMDLPMYIIIGEEDESVPVKDMEDFYNMIKENYIDKSKISFEIQKGIGHSVSPQAFDKSVTWLKSYLIK
jgi:uncharacterized protein